MSPFTKLLVPTDFSDGALVAIERALELRQRYGASLTLIHAYELPVSYTEGYPFSIEIVESIEEGARSELAKATARVEQHAKEWVGTGAAPPLSSKLVLGAAAASIVDEAREGGYDLIVMGTHGRTGISRLFIGSVAERVVRTAPCAVLTIR